MNADVHVKRPVQQIALFQAMILVDFPENFVLLHKGKCLNAFREWVS